MDLGQDATRIPPRSPIKPKPLHVRKQSSHVQLARSQQHLNENKTYQEHYKTPVYPPRTSSIREVVQSFDIPQDHATLAEPPSGLGSTTRSSLSSYRDRYISVTSPELPSTGVSTTRSTAASYKESYLSDASPEIMGDFVPINPLDMAYRPATAEGSKIVFHSSVNSRKFPKLVNPYEFEPSTPDNNETRQTATFNVMNDEDDTSTSSPQLSHMKNSLSEGNAVYTTQRPDPPIVYASKPTSYGIHRSESSPTVSPFRFSPGHEGSLSPELYLCDLKGDVLRPAHRGRHRSEDRYRDGRQDADGELPPPHETNKVSTPESSPRPSRLPRQESLHYAYSRNLTGSPTKGLGDVCERDEFDAALSRQSASPPPTPPKKRSRSPMKKMFGEHGWLGQSPNDETEQILRPKNSPSRKKNTMMGKLKNKLEEIAEKADLTPIFRSDYEKYTKLAMLSISLGPPEQARIYMEVELMLVHTANNFLMTQFSQGRIAVESIKKTVDTWKSKGRPLVIEFMYDQATQRELIVANQHNFRFHGDTAGSAVRVSSMLYNWKQVASLMSIRTFCSADTVILKLLFDIEQILELLGAGGPLLLRLQQVRATANKNIRIARHNEDVKAATQTYFQSRVVGWNQRPLFGSSRDGKSFDDAYGGIKLVPDSYIA